MVLKNILTPTQTLGGIIDHIYIRLVNQGSFQLEMNSKTYTDQDSLNLIETERIL